MRLPCVLVMVCLAGAARAQERLSGSWQGYWTRAGDTMPVTMSVQYDANTGRYAATFAADRLRVAGIPFNEVRLEGCCEVRLLLRGDRTTIEFTGRLHGDSFSGVLTDSDGDGRFAYARVPAVTPLFDERDITFSSGAVTLSGTLLLPFTGDSLPAVVFLHGSGAEGRWASRFLAAKLAAGVSPP